MKTLKSIFGKLFQFPLQTATEFWNEEEEKRPTLLDPDMHLNAGSYNEVETSVRRTEERVSGFEARLKAINGLGVRQ